MKKLRVVMTGDPLKDRRSDLIAKIILAKTQKDIDMLQKELAKVNKEIRGF
jgi:hypothetical protein